MPLGICHLGLLPSYQMENQKVDTGPILKDHLPPGGWHFLAAEQSKDGAVPLAIMPRALPELVPGGRPSLPFVSITKIPGSPCSSPGSSQQ